MVEEIFAEMRRLTSGGLSLAELRRRGHPYGRGRGRVTKGKRGARVRVTARGSAPLLPINRQSGGLQSRAFRQIVSRTLTRQVIDAGYRAGANWVLLPGGTKKMVDRRFWKAIAEFAKRAQRRLLDDVWKYEFSYR